MLFELLPVTNNNITVTNNVFVIKLIFKLKNYDKIKQILKNNCFNN